MTLKPMNCPNCGGTVDRARMICEYCGTKFDNHEHSDLGVMRIEHYTSPTRIFGVTTRIPNELQAFDSDIVIGYAKQDIAKKLVDNLLAGEMIEFSSEMDWQQCQQVITARLRVLDPHYRF